MTPEITNNKDNYLSKLFNPVLVHEFLSSSAKNFPDKEALVTGEQRFTYKEIDKQSDLLASGLINIGVQRHDRIIIFSDNSAETVIGIYGILKAGATFVLLNGSLKSHKLQYIIKDSGAKLIIVQSSKKNVIDQLNQGSNLDISTIWFGQKEITEQKNNYYWDDFLKSNFEKIEALQKRKSEILDYDLATLIYTSGSTGEPKGVMSSHNNMISAARSIIQYIDNEPNDKILVVLPLSFDYGLYQVIMTFMFGGTIILEKSFNFPVEILKILQKEKVTGFPIVPTILAMFLKLKNISNYDLSSLRYISNTGAALPVDHIKKFREIFPAVKLFSMFGLTECKRISYLHPDMIDKKPGSVGKAIPNCETFIVNENSEMVKPGEVGELVVRGSNVMRGYWNAEELTSKVYKKWKLDGEKVLFTGDLFYEDEDGFLYFVGRKDDMIKTKGERVSPKEIENILCDLEGVSETAVIGFPDEILGQSIKVFIVKKNEKKLSKNDVLLYCSKNMETFMVPKEIVFLDALPKSPNGKVDKKLLKQMD
ncbi:MAG: class I adenylate-forming enzyme family protein [Ignavibacteriaceae bacterium]